MDFGSLGDKAKDLAEEHSDQVDGAIDKGADAVGNKLGHEDQVDQGAEKLKDVIPGGE